MSTKRIIFHTVRQLAPYLPLDPPARVDDSEPLRARCAATGLIGSHRRGLGGTARWLTINQASQAGAPPAKCAGSCTAKCVLLLVLLRCLQNRVSIPFEDKSLRMPSAANEHI
eukprot:1196096-Pleurochrysis_carterae.AAC.1